jgi:hypothetical protein
MLRGSEELTRSVLLCFAVPCTIYPWPYDGPFFSRRGIIAILTFLTNTESLSRPLSKHQSEQKNKLFNYSSLPRSHLEHGISSSFRLLYSLL